MQETDLVLPKYIDPFQFSETSEKIVGYLELSKLTRLHDLVLGRDAKLYCQLQFSLVDGYAHCLGQVQGALEMRCQRCMQPFDYEVNIAINVSFLPNQKLATRLAKHADVVVVDERKLMLADLVVDELLLALPMVPKHKDLNCAHAKN